MNKNQKIILGLGAVGLSAYLIYKYNNKKNFDAGFTQSQANSLVTQRKNADPISSIESICNNLGGFYSYKGGPDFSILSPEGCTNNCQRCLIQKSASQVACENAGGTFNKYGEECSVNAPAPAPVVTQTSEYLKSIPEYWKYMVGTYQAINGVIDPSVIEYEKNKKNTCESSGKLWYVDIQGENRTYYCLPKPPAPTPTPPPDKPIFVDEKCPAGKVKVDGKCVAPAPAPCPAGQVRVNGKCKSTTPAPAPCPDGKVMVNVPGLGGKCVVKTTPTPAPQPTPTPTPTLTPEKSGTDMMPFVIVGGVALLLLLKD